MCASNSSGHGLLLTLLRTARARPRYKGGARFAAERQAGVGLRVDLRAKEADSAYAAPPNDAHTRMLAALLNPKLNATLEVCRSAIQAIGRPPVRCCTA
jgi:hypothetical protein